MINGKIQYCPLCGTTVTEKIHSGRLRPTCPQCEWVYFPDPKVAVAILITKDNQVLLVQRLYNPKKGYWTLPSGFIDAGEDPKSAAERECVEETGLKIKDIRLLDVVFSQEHPRGASILILYRAEVRSGELVPGDDANQAAYFQINNLPPLAFTSTRQILTKYS
jgi:ADP-ribose pyrophosphatase YjhB (NUDIX family)